VGDRYVLQGLEEKGWVIGGEPSGHILTLEITIRRTCCACHRAQ
jgi:phosphomannomutase